MRERHAAAFPHIAFLEDAAPAASTVRPVPVVAAEQFAVHLLQARDDQVLQLKQILSDGYGIEVAHIFARISCE